MIASPNIAICIHLNPTNFSLTSVKGLLMLTCVSLLILWPNLVFCDKNTECMFLTSIKLGAQCLFSICPLRWLLSASLWDFTPLFDVFHLIPSSQELLTIGLLPCDLAPSASSTGFPISKCTCACVHRLSTS